MGGDDLGDDFNFLDAPVGDSEETKSEKKEKKRKRAESSEIDAEEESVADGEVPTKKSFTKVLIEAGRSLEKESAEVQCTFLNTSLAHYTQLERTSVGNLPKLKPSMFKVSSEATLEARLRSVVSMKKLKKWKPVGSPMVVIVCQSARRAVEILKELAGMKIRCAKLFSKHLDLDHQKEMIAMHSYGIAVGTPHRIQALCEPEQKGGKAPLYFGKTQVVLLDSHANQKGYTVCTLPDTTRVCMGLLREQILPQFKKRKDIHIAVL